MSTRIIPFEKEEYYHIYNRGNSKQTIFHDNDDMSRFQDLLYISNNTDRFAMKDLSHKDTISKANTIPEESRLVAIGSYCIMPNHFHILLTPLVDGGVSKFMQKLSTAYPMYYNKKYAHTGGLFEGKFKSKHASDDRYLKYLFAYINLNPVKLFDSTWKKYGIKDAKKTFTFLETYTHSSYLDLLYYGDKGKGRNRPEADILSLDEFPEYFPTGADFKKEIVTWFSYRNDF